LGCSAFIFQRLMKISRSAPLWRARWYGICSIALAVESDPVKRMCVSPGAYGEKGELYAKDITSSRGRYRDDHGIQLDAGAVGRCDRPYSTAAANYRHGGGHRGRDRGRYDHRRD
jgi:hypothetical protein